MREADALINLCGATRLRDEHMGCPVRIMVDTDPVYEQIKYAEADPAARAYLDAHTHFFTYGENVGGPGWLVPLCRHRLAADPAAGRCSISGPAAAAEPRLLHDHRDLGEQGQEHRVRRRDLSLVEARQFPPLPRSAAAAAAHLLQHGDAAADDGGRAARSRAPAGASSIRGPSRPTWRATGDFIRGSRGEFTVAKDIYVRPNSGWFSDRSRLLPRRRPAGRDHAHRLQPASTRSGEGLFDYATHDEAVAAIDAIAADYPGHSRAARDIAAGIFRRRPGSRRHAWRGRAVSRPPAYLLGRSA